MVQRIILLVLDGLGIGAAPDAEDYRDSGAHTLAHLAEAGGGVTVPHLESLGLGNLVGDVKGLRAVAQPEGCFGRMQPRSKGKDSTSGHWEIGGVVLQEPFPTYPHGFPQEIIKPFEEAIGRKILGNCAASGTAIIGELGEQHCQTGFPIVYTSADSVFQVSAHEDVMNIADLYQACRVARKLLVPPHQVARVIARPFRGKFGAYVRSPQRKDFSIDCPGQTLLDELHRAGQLVIGIGKVDDLFNHRGLTRSIRTGNNAEGMAEATRVLQTVPRGLIFVNLGDFDSSYGHRNDPKGFGQALEEFDAKLGELLPHLRSDDLLCITADHGNDPTMPGTDHTREYVPLLVHGPRVVRGVNLGTRNTFADLGQTLAEALGAARLACGESFLDVVYVG